MSRITSFIFATMLVILGHSSVLAEDSVWGISGKISVDIKSDCYSPEYPLRVTVKNNSLKTIENLEFEVMARIPGRSTNIAIGGWYTSDIIVKSFSEKESCWRAPRLQHDLNVKEVEWDVKIRKINGEWQH